jgi:hypothetical protein
LGLGTGGGDLLRGLSLLGRIGQGRTRRQGRQVRRGHLGIRIGGGRGIIRR